MDYVFTFYQYGHCFDEKETIFFQSRENGQFQFLERHFKINHMGRPIAWSLFSTQHWGGNQISALRVRGITETIQKYIET